MGVTVFQCNFTYKNRKWVRFWPLSHILLTHALDNYLELLKIIKKDISYLPLFHPFLEIFISFYRSKFLFDIIFLLPEEFPWIFLVVCTCWWILSVFVGPKKPLFLLCIYFSSLATFKMFSFFSLSFLKIKM